MQSGRLGALQLGVPYREVLNALGPADRWIEGDYPLYGYRSIEVMVDNRTGLVDSIQIEPFRGSAEVPETLCPVGRIDVPAGKEEFSSLLEEWGIEYEFGEFHVPGQEELMIRESGVSRTRPYSHTGL